MSDSEKPEPEQTLPKPELVPDPDRLPGQRDGLPPGALGGLPTEPPQADENRDPPGNVPTVPE